MQISLEIEAGNVGREFRYMEYVAFELAARRHFSIASIGTIVLNRLFVPRWIQKFLKHAASFPREAIQFGGRSMECGLKLWRR